MSKLEYWRSAVLRGEIAAEDVPQPYQNDLGDVEPCNHRETVVERIIVRCTDPDHPDCRRIWQVDPPGSDSRLQAAAQQILHGLIDAETVVAGGAWSDSKKMILLSIKPCRHDDYEEYECRCAHVTRYRCRGCGKTVDHPSVFGRLQNGSS